MVSSWHSFSTLWNWPCRHFEDSIMQSQSLPIQSHKNCVNIDGKRAALYIMLGGCLMATVIRLWQLDRALISSPSFFVFSSFWYDTRCGLENWAWTINKACQRCLYKWEESGNNTVSQIPLEVFLPSKATFCFSSSVAAPYLLLLPYLFYG